MSNLGLCVKQNVLRICFAANIVLFPLSYFVNSSAEASRSQLADSSINILLILIHYRKCILVESVKNNNASVTSDSLLKDETYFAENPYCKALENVRDVECKILLSFEFCNQVLFLSFYYFVSLIVYCIWYPILQLIGWILREMHMVVRL